MHYYHRRSYYYCCKLFVFSALASPLFPIRSSPADRRLSECTFFPTRDDRYRRILEIFYTFFFATTTTYYYCRPPIVLSSSVALYISCVAYSRACGSFARYRPPSMLPTPRKQVLFLEVLVSAAFGIDYQLAVGSTIIIN